MRLGTALHSVAVVNRGINHIVMGPTPARATGAHKIFLRLII